MNKKQGIAIILLIVAIVLSLMSIVLNASIDRIEGDGEKSVQRDAGATQGTIQLLVMPQGTTDKGNSSK